MKNKIIICLGIIVLILLAYVLIQKTMFPIAYKVCGIGYVDCRTVAKFEDLQGCQAASEKGTWLCDSSNSENINCRVSKSSIAIGYCTE
jgi:hypothetical protein